MCEHERGSLDCHEFRPRSRLPTCGDQLTASGLYKVWSRSGHMANKSKRERSRAVLDNLTSATYFELEDFLRLACAFRHLQDIGFAFTVAVDDVTTDRKELRTSTQYRAATKDDQFDSQSYLSSLNWHSNWTAFKCINQPFKYCRRTTRLATSSTCTDFKIILRTTCTQKNC
eukprot:3639854-Amphidinium_carterae.3